jgi:hypothetical protein
MKKICIVDYLSPSGHRYYVKKMAEILSKRYKVILIASAGMCCDSNVYEYYIIEEKYLKFKNKYEFVYNQIKTHYFVRNIIKLIKGIDCVLVVGFENISTFITMAMRKNNGYYYLCHNNLDKNGLSGYLLKYIIKKNNIIVLEDYIVKCFSKNRINKINHVPHVMNYIAEDCFEKNSGYIFAPSVSEMTFELLKALSVKYNKHIYIKTKSVDDVDICFHGYMHVKEYYEDYIEKIKNAEFVYIDVKHQYRVSGIFYESMLYNKVIYIPDNPSLFLLEMKNKYKNSVFYLSEYPVLVNKENKAIDYKRFIDEHSNDKVLDDICAVINKKNE